MADSKKKDQKHKKVKRIKEKNIESLLIILLNYVRDL